MNMRHLRIALLIFFCITAAVFAFFRIRERMNSDNVPPVIHAESDTLEVPVSATDEDLLSGMTARDNLDGDVTDTLVVVSRGKFVTPGTLHVKYAAFDNNRNVGTYTREVTYTDYVSPHFSMDTPLRFAAAGSSPDYLAHITARDCLDGNITQQIKITMGGKIVVSDSVTKQKMNVQVTNSCGDSAVLELTVSMEDYSTLNRPAPALKDYILYVREGGSLDLRGNISGVWMSGSVKGFAESGFDSADVSIYDGGLNLRVPGVYTVTYRLSHDGVAMGSAELIVVVEG